MNTKFFFAMIVVLIVLVAALAPAAAGRSAEKVGGNTPAPTYAGSVEARLWSGAIDQSDNNSPDQTLKVEPVAKQHAQTGCITENSQPKRASGCLE